MEENDSGGESTSSQSSSRHILQQPDSFRRFNANDFESIEYELLQGSRMNSTFLYIPSEKQLYRIKHIMSFGKSYVCREKKCFARVFLKENGECKRFKSNSHLHSDKEEEYNKLKVLNEVKLKCAELHSTLVGRKLTTKSIFDQVIQK